MWLVYTLLFAFFLSLVNYVDEWLTAKNALPQSTDIHTKIGGLMIISTFFSLGGALVMYFSIGSVALSSTPFLLSLLSAIPMVLMWAGYFYLLNLYPVYQVIPMFSMGTIWLLMLELSTGGTITLVPLIGVAILVVSAYVLDTGSLSWRIPTSLLPYMAGVSLCSALAHFMERHAALGGADPVAITFWQFSGIVGIGVLLFILVRQYRVGFLFRVRNQGRQFVGLSIFNEGSSQIAYYCGIVAVSLAPLATYVSALGGVQSIMLLGLFTLFPQKPVSINKLQVVAICTIAIGIFLLEGWKYV